MRQKAMRVRREVRVLPPSACTHASWMPCPLAPELYEMCFNCRTKRRRGEHAHIAPATDEQAPVKPIQGSLF